ncbi:MAG: Large exoprotein involved in heme utilization or adhesion, partial [Alphaproteobacteria bacterium]|nr:Large exoprotein involved in heme utilization or adhesion [Alphaproteobacteria bacterium]
MSQNKAQNSALRLLNATLMGKKLLASTAITVAGVLAASSSAYAVGLDETPTGGTVVAGQSTITYGQGSMTVDQTTDRSVINWNTFNIGENAGAVYNQPGVNSLSVNRVTGADPSKILGTLRSNGKIMIIDPNGVFFSKTAKVDVGGIIATTGELDAMNQDQLMAGNKFQISNIGANPDAKIENAGRITAAQGGLVAFVAPWVSNSGFINAKLGSVTLAAGAKMTVDLAGDNLISIAVNDKLQKALVENSGTIDAQGGRVVMSANAAKGIVDEVINMSGVIKANSFSQKGGKIILGGGSSGVVKVSGKIEANGETGGGEIEIKGENIFVTESGELHADGVTCGNGGAINIVAQNGLIYGGLATAKGGALWGNGGFVDTSGLEWVDIWGGVDASAPNGLAGTWLIDPRDLVITTAASAAVDTGGTNGSSDNPFNPNNSTLFSLDQRSKLNVTTVNNALNGGTDVHITTVGSPDKLLQDGTITVDANISKTGGDSAVLYMTAAGSIVVNSGKTISSTSDTLGIDFTAAKNIDIKGTINTNGGNVK